MYSNQDYLSELLVEAGLVTPEQIEEIRGTLGPNDGIINRLLLDATVSERQIAETIAVNTGNDYIDIEHTPILPDVFEHFPVEVAQRFRAVPLADDGTYMTVAVADALDFEVLDALPHVVGREVQFVSATPTGIAKALKDNYGVVEQSVGSGDSFTVIGSEGEEVADANDAPIIRLVSNMLLEAFKMRASDIHIEPLGDLGAGPLPGRRQAGRGGHPSEEAAAGHHRPPQGDERHDVDRRETAAAGRPDPDAGSAARRSTCGFRRCRRNHGESDRDADSGQVRAGARTCRNSASSPTTRRPSSS